MPASAQIGRHSSTLLQCQSWLPSTATTGMSSGRHASASTSARWLGWQWTSPAAAIRTRSDMSWPLPDAGTALTMDLNAAEFKGIVEGLRKAAAAFRDADVRYCLSGSVASWARGGPETVNDVDLIVHPPDMEKAVAALEALDWKSE